MKRLPEISIALGPERTRSELIPYLNEFVEDEDDVLITLAEQLPPLIDYVARWFLSLLHCIKFFSDWRAWIRASTVFSLGDDRQR